jgi:3-hydroxyacyl-CoA dehydrogenase
VDGDVIVPHKDELLHVAIAQAKAMAESGLPPAAQGAVPGGRPQCHRHHQGPAVPTMRDGGFASAHDFHIATLIAEVVCGGDVDAGSLVTEEYLMTLEREHFCALLEHPKTQERIMGMLQTGN